MVTKMPTPICGCTKFTLKKIHNWDDTKKIEVCPPSNFILRPPLVAAVLRDAELVVAAEAEQVAEEGVLGGRARGRFGPSLDRLVPGGGAQGRPTPLRREATRLGTCHLGFMGGHRKGRPSRQRWGGGQEHM
jgi:hypothetical protein